MAEISWHFDGFCCRVYYTSQNPFIDNFSKSIAARIDGASDWGIFWRVILPLTQPALATVALFTFLGCWNDFLGPLIFLNDGNKYTLAVGLAAFRGQYRTQWDLMMATVITLPIVVIFFFAQKRFIQGITLTGMKG